MPGSIVLIYNLFESCEVNSELHVGGYQLLDNKLVDVQRLELFVFSNTAEEL